MKTTCTTNASATKLVDYSYPTSPNATKHGFGKVGCYTVSIAKGHAPGKDAKAFPTKEEAMTFAESLPMPFHRFQTFTR